MVLKLLSDNGGRIRAVKPFMVFEARYVQANCLGLQMEFSKYYHSLTRLDLEGKRHDTDLSFAEPVIDPVSNPAHYSTNSLVFVCFNCAKFKY